MKKIIYYSFYPNDASAFYRSTGIFHYINHPDLSITNISHKNHLSFSDFCGYDTLFLQRPCEQHHLNLIKLAKDVGLKVIIDYDDDPLHLDMYNPMYDYYEQHKSTVLDCIVEADEIWASTIGVKKAFRLFNNNIQVISNAHNDYIYPIEEKKEFNANGKLAMWRGGHSHVGDIYEIGVPELLISIINDNQDWMFKFLGQRFEYLEKRCGDNYIAQSGASTIQFYKMMHNENPNIVFYPLADTLFNESKSNICWIEATYAGAAFFGNTSLQEFSGIGIMPIDYLSGYVSKDRNEALQIANNVAWQYIQENLLLSSVNDLRIQRLLS